MTQRLNLASRGIIKSDMTWKKIRVALQKHKMDYDHTKFNIGDFNANDFFPLYPIDQYSGLKTELTITTNDKSFKTFRILYDDFDNYISKEKRRG